MELNDDSIDDEVAIFALVDTIKKLLEKLREKVKCSLDALGEIIGEGELRNVYKKFRADVESILRNDALECLKIRGAIEKLKWAKILIEYTQYRYVQFIRFEILDTYF